MPTDPAPTAGEGSGTQNPTPAPKASTDVLGPDGKPLDPGRALAAIERLKGEATKVPDLESQLAESNRKLKEFEDSQLSETEKVTNRNSELESENLTLKQENQMLRLGSALQDAAAKAGARYPDAVAKLIDFASIEFDAAGAPKNLDKLLEQVAKSYPDMFNGTRPGRVDAGARTPQAGRTMNDIIREAAGRGR